MRLNRLLTSTGAALLLASGLATQANAGAINMDFLLDTNTVITGADVLDSSTTNASDHKTSALTSATSVTFGVDLGASGFSAFAGKTLDITGTRTNTYSNLAKMRMTRYQGNGLGVCSLDASGVCLENHEVDGDNGDESIKFSISQGSTPNAMEFAVRQVTFKFADTDGNDDGARMRFSTGLGAFVDFELNGSGFSSCTGGTCKVDIYALVEAAAAAANPGADPDYVAFNTDAIWNAGQDYIYNYLASAAGFEFQALGGDTCSIGYCPDDWKIAGAVWVGEDPITNGVPEPASMTLLGAGIMGLGYLNRRRKAA